MKTHNTPFVTRLIEALPQYEDRRVAGTLRQGDCFCAIGVACNLLVQENPERFSWEETEVAATSVAPGHTFIFVDRVFAERREMTAPQAVHDLIGSTVQIMGMSDMGSPFADIAEYLRQRELGA